MQDYSQALGFIQAITGDADNAIVDFRLIHDTNKDVQALPIRGTLAQCWQTILTYQAQGYGAFCVVSEMDGSGLKLANVRVIRAHYADLDSINAHMNYERAVAWEVPPSFAVQSSPGKYHVYWCVEPYQAGNDWFNLHQRKLRTLFDGDECIIDPTRVMRLPGSLHLKQPSAPHLVTCWSLAGIGQRVAPARLAGALASIAADVHAEARRGLGNPDLAAPSLEWVRYGLSLVDPNEIARDEWIAITAAAKQAAWTHGSEQEIYAIWSEWCARYTSNDLGENLKQWNSLTETQLGWKSMLNRIPSLKAAWTIGKPTIIEGGNVAPLPSVAPGSDHVTTPAMPEPPAADCKGEFLTDAEQRQWFKGCTFVINIGEMLTADNRFLNATQFNVAYGGKRFLINSVGKDTNEAWQAATRSTLWTVPKVDHIRFVPSRPFGETIVDDMGRPGINTYKPLTIRRRQGDPSPFLRHIAALLPNDADRKIFMDYLAHNVRYPGHKIAWAPLIQSTEGAGKGVLKSVMSHCMGRSYTYFPNAKDLSDSGAKFNAWMRNRLFILVDEIRVDERRDLIEVLKPMISENAIEIQAKGHDQSVEDNFANWMFFSNYKDAIPINKNARRFAIFYTPFQTVDDLERAQMGAGYFNWLYSWLDNGGVEIVADYLLNYPIERGAVPMRAPDTSSTTEAVSISRGPIERVVTEAIEDALAGFRGGWLSSLSVAARLKTKGVRVPSERGLEAIITGMGYVSLGRAPRAYFRETGTDLERSHLFHLSAAADVHAFGPTQGWE